MRTMAHDGLGTAFQNELFNHFSTKLSDWLKSGLFNPPKNIKE
jgi:hypothetical protein